MTLGGKARGFCTVACIAEHYSVEELEANGFAWQNFYNPDRERVALLRQMLVSHRLTVDLLLAGTAPTVDPYAYHDAWKEFLPRAQPYIDRAGDDQEERRLRYQRVYNHFRRDIARLMTLQAAHRKGLDVSRCHFEDCTYPWKGLLLHLQFCHGSTRAGNTARNKAINVGGEAGNGSFRSCQQILQELEKDVHVGCANRNASSADTMAYKACKTYEEALRDEEMLEEYKRRRHYRFQLYEARRNGRPEAQCYMCGAMFTALTEDQQHMVTLLAYVSDPGEEGEEDPHATGLHDRVSAVLQESLGGASGECGSGGGRRPRRRSSPHASRRIGEMADRMMAVEEVDSLMAEADGGQEGQEDGQLQAKWEVRDELALEEADGGLLPAPAVEGLEGNYRATLLASPDYQQFLKHMPDPRKGGSWHPSLEELNNLLPGRGLEDKLRYCVFAEGTTSAGKVKYTSAIRDALDTLYPSANATERKTMDFIINELYRTRTVACPNCHKVMDAIRTRACSTFVIEHRLHDHVHGPDFFTPGKGAVDAQGVPLVSGWSKMRTGADCRSYRCWGLSTDALPPEEWCHPCSEGKAGNCQKVEERLLELDSLVKEGHLTDEDLRQHLRQLQSEEP